MPNPRSTARIGGHPIHPMLIPFPIAFFVATLGCDLAFWSTANSDWFAASAWLLGAGIVMALFAALAGLIDLLGDARIRALRAVWWHAGGNLLLVAVQIVSWYIRHSEGPAVVVPTGLILSVVAVLLMLFTGWMGWQMVYRDHVAVSDDANPKHRVGEPIRNVGR
jgi:uncharacterized membrane protein